MRFPRIFLNRSIKDKLNATMIVALSLIAVFITIFFPARQKHLAFEQLKTKTLTLGQMLAENLSAALEFEDIEAIGEGVVGIWKDEDVIGLRVADREGKVLFNYLSTAQANIMEKYNLPEEGILEVPGEVIASVPIYARNNKVGSLILRISTLKVVEQAWANRRLTIIVSLVLLLLGAVLSHFFASHITSHLFKLTEMTQKISGGDLSHRIDIESKDEIGELATSFNKMVSSLRKAQLKNQLYLQKIQKSNVILQQQQKEIEAYSHTLEKRVEERTARLNQAYEELFEKNVELEKTLEALKRSQEQVREAEKLAVIGEIAGRVAHEVLNPITALLSRAESEVDFLNVSQKAVGAMKEIIADWQENLKNGKLSEYLLQKSPETTDSTYGEEDMAILSQAAERNADNLRRSQEFVSFLEHHIMKVVKIIDNLREMARARREIEEVDVNSCLKEIAELYQDGLRKRNINFNLKLSPDSLPKIYVDYTELFQVFSNLLRNAMQAVESKREGKGEITFTSEVVGEQIWVRVIDNGVGIPEENKVLIFEHSFSTKSRKEGTGLGLSISQRLVKEMGGELTLEFSKSGLGATFLVRLPLMPKPQPAEINGERGVETIA